MHERSRFPWAAGGGLALLTARLLLVVAAAALLTRLGTTWWARLPYPYDLEWMEGGMLAHAWRMVEGLPVYPGVNPDFVPYIYPPGYPATLAGVGALVGLSPLLGRGLALLGSLAAAAALVHVHRRLGVSRTLAGGSALAFLGTYPLTGAFLDLVRPDGLLLGLLGWSVALTLDGRRGTPWASGALLCAAILTKHNALALLPALWVTHAWRSRGDGLRFLAAAVLPLALAVSMLQVRSDGRFLVYLLQVPRAHPMYPDRVWPLSFYEIGNTLPVLIVALGAGWGVAAVSAARPPPWVTAPFLSVIAVGAGAWTSLEPGKQVLEAQPALGAAISCLALTGGTAFLLAHLRGLWQIAPEALGQAALLLTSLAVDGLMRAHDGGYVNVHLPLLWTLVLVAGPWLQRAGPRLGATLLALQLVWAGLSLDRAALVPRPADRRHADQLVAALAEREGPVLSPYAAWLPTYAGHPPSLHYMSLWDLDHKRGVFHRDLQVIRDAVRSHYWPTAVSATRAFPYGLDDAYRVVDGVGPHEPVLPRTGYSVGPKAVWTPKGGR